MRYGGDFARRAREDVPRGTRAPVLRPAAALAPLAALVLAAAPSPAGAAERFVVRGGGFGHGVGLSQYGAKGMAARGVPVASILAHYYRGTTLGRAEPRNVRVALQWGRTETTISGAASIGGLRTRTNRSYRVIRTGSGLEIRQVGRKRRFASAASGVKVVPGGGGVLRVAGRAADGVQDGSFRGTIDVLPDASNVLVVDDLDLEQYLRGVVTEESPSGWPAGALQAQAIVARTYAITNRVGGRQFDQWPDTRSQVYTGVSGETAQGDAAIAATRGRIVTLGGRPVITYFFSTSGGRTEDSSNVFGGEDRSWLQSVPDPYEADAPLHRWTRTFSMSSADARTARFGVGALDRIDVVRRGDSPRVVRARVLGTGGTKEVSGQDLQLAFDLPDRWASFAAVSMSGCLRAGLSPAERRAERQARIDAEARAEARRRADDPRNADAGAGVGVVVTFEAPDDDGGAAGAPTPAPPVAPPGTTTTGTTPTDTTPAPASAPAPAKARSQDRRCRLVGGVRPAPDGAAGRLQRRVDGRWSTVRRVALRGGRFETVVPRAGVWRVRVGGFSTPVARL